MRFIKFITFLFYKYYSAGATKSVAYLKTIGSMVLLIFIQICILLIVINRTDLLPFVSSEKKEIKYLKVALYTAPIFLFFFFFIKEGNLKAASYDDLKVKRAEIYLIGYIIFSMVLLFVLMFAFAEDQ